MSEKHITQTIEHVGDAAYKVTLEIDGNTYEEHYERSNAVFPAYKTIINAIKTLENVSHVTVTTNSEQLIYEYNKLPNKNATLLRQLRETAALKGVTLSVKNKE